MKDNRSKELKILGIQPKETKRFLGIEKTTTNYHIGDDVTVRADGKLNKKTVIESASETKYKITPKFWIGLGLFVLAAAIATVLVLSGPAAVITLPLLVKASTVLTGLMAKAFAGISTAAVAIFGKGAAFTVGSAVTAWVTPFATAVASVLSVGILTGLAIGVASLIDKKVIQPLKTKAKAKAEAEAKQAPVESRGQAYSALGTLLGSREDYLAAKRSPEADDDAHAHSDEVIPSFRPDEVEPTSGMTELKDLARRAEEDDDADAGIKADGVM